MPEDLKEQYPAAGEILKEAAEESNGKSTAELMSETFGKRIAGRLRIALDGVQSEEISALIAELAWAEYERESLLDSIESLSQRNVDRCRVRSPRKSGPTVAEAREAIVRAFEKDPQFREVYVANVAMLLHDQYGITDPATRNRAGSAIVDLVFKG